MIQLEEDRRKHSGVNPKNINVLYYFMKLVLFYENIYGVLKRKIVELDTVLEFNSVSRK